MDITEKALGPDDPRTVALVEDLGLLLLDEAEYEQSGPLLRRAIATVEKTRGEGHLDLVPLRANLARLYEFLENDEAAERMYLRTFALLPEDGGYDFVLVANARINLAMIYREQGRLAEAEPLEQQGLAVLAEAMGPDHPYIKSVIKQLQEIEVKQE